MMTSELQPNQWRVSHGTVQCYVIRPEPHAMIFYGRAEYDRDKPVMNDSLREQGQAVCDALNAGEITETEAQERLKKAYW